VTHASYVPEIKVFLLMRKHLKELNFIGISSTNPDDIQCTPVVVVVVVNFYGFSSLVF
jgi:hypothetical protein